MERGDKMKKIIVHGFFFVAISCIALRTLYLLKTKVWDLSYISWMEMFQNSRMSQAFQTISSIQKQIILEFIILFLVLAFLYKIAKDFINE